MENIPKEGISESWFKELENKFKGKGFIFSYSLKYLPTYQNCFFVNKQYDNKNFSIVATSESGLSESVIGLFKTKKSASEFGLCLGLKEVKNH